MEVQRSDCGSETRPSTDGQPSGDSRHQSIVVPAVSVPLSPEAPRY